MQYSLPSAYHIFAPKTWGNFPLLWATAQPYQIHTLLVVKFQNKYAVSRERESDR